MVDTEETENHIFAGSWSFILGLREVKAIYDLVSARREEKTKKVL